jgi:hypothetical protein
MNLRGSIHVDHSSMSFELTGGHHNDYDSMALMIEYILSE